MDRSARGRRTASHLTGAAEAWADTCQDRPGPVCATICMGMIPVCAYPAMGAALLLSIWAWVQIMNSFRPSCCRATGLVAMTMISLGTALGPSPLPPLRSFPFVAFETCQNASAPSTFFARAVDSELPGTPCPVTPAPTPEIQLALGPADLTADATYRPVLLLPTGAYARLSLLVEDHRGSPLVPRTILELGPDDSLPLTSRAHNAASPPLSVAPRPTEGVRRHMAATWQ